MNVTELSLREQSTAIDGAVSGEVVAWWNDYAALTKPRILLMILMTVGMGMVAQSHQQLDPWMLLHTMLGTGLIAASASILNQWLEQDRDARMERTRRRPLPSGRLTSFEAVCFGWATGVIGFAYLMWMTNLVATAVGLATWVAYVWIYTPLKTRSWWNTAVGTLPGALPVMIGWTAAGGGVADVEAWLLTSVVILWQFPHFMSIAWLYRDQYAAAGYRMITNEEPSGYAAGWHAVLASFALIPITLFAVMPKDAVTILLAVAGLCCCGWLMMASMAFLRNRDEHTARKLLHASLAYLPSVMVIVIIRACL